MLKEAENKVKIEGILAEINLEPTSFEKNGTRQEAIRGNIIVNVTQKISGVETDLSIPVHMFATKYTKKGTSNPAYESIKRVLDEFKSIAATGDIDEADRIRITNARVNMNEYYSADGRLIAFPRIMASFVNKIGKAECKPEATFSTQFVVAKKSEELDKNGEPTGRYRIDTIIPMYGGRVDVVPMFAQSEGVISAISTYWEIGDTVRANGRLNFTVKTETTLKEVDFGEPIEETRTISVSELIITGGSQEPLPEELAFDSTEIQEALEQRKINLEALKNKPSAKKAPSQEAKNGFADLGF